MPTKIIKRLNVSANSAFYLLKEILTSSLGWTLTASSVFSVSISSGADGEVLSAQPDRFRSAANPFTVADIGKWLVLSGSEFSNNGVYQIIGVPSAGELLLSGGLYGASFVDSTLVSFKVVDPTVAAPADYFVVAGPLGSPAPPWETLFTLTASGIDIVVSPAGGWNGGVWTVPVPPSVSIDESVGNPSWYFLVDDTHIRMWTQNLTSTGVENLAYVGAGDARRPASDTRFVVAFAGLPAVSAAGALASISAMDTTLLSPVNYSALTYGDATVAAPNLFSSVPPLTSSSFDLRNDSAKIPIGTDDVGFVEDDRGYLRGMHYISDQIPYLSFVDNGRSLLSLGNGVAVEWDGSLSR